LIKNLFYNLRWAIAYTYIRWEKMFLKYYQLDTRRDPHYALGLALSKEKIPKMR